MVVIQRSSSDRRMRIAPSGSLMDFGPSPGQQVGRCEDEFEPGGVDVEVAGGEAAEAGGLAVPDVVLAALVTSTPRSCPADHGRSQSRIEVAVTVPWKM